MKKKVVFFIAILIVIVLGISVWIYGYCNRKNNDNIPNLISIAQMDEAEVNELLVGYHKIQLREVWEKPNETSSNEDIWIINEKTALIVSYNNDGIVVVCGLSIKN